MTSIEELYENYIQERLVNLTIEQFTLFAEFFPAVLVIVSDGIFDHKEKTYLEKLVQSLGKSFSEDGFGTKRVQELKSIFAQEFEYLITHIDIWQELYLKALKTHLQHYPESKETILETIYLFAQHSQDFDEAESNMVSFLTSELRLLDTKLS
jgi:hypothetical protein